MPNPNSIVSKYTYDPVTNRYIYTETVGKFNINYPIILTPAEYQKLVLQEALRNITSKKLMLKMVKKMVQKKIRKIYYLNFTSILDFLKRFLEEIL